MANIKDVLRKLNKSREDDDKIRFADKHPQDYFIRKHTSTGSVALDFATGGGYAQGAYNTIVGDGGTGKSSMALLAIKKEWEATGRKGIYYDGEGTLDSSYMDRMGVTRDMLVYIKDRNLENMLDDVEAFSTADDVGVIVIDSIPIFVSDVVKNKSASENNMAVEARKYTARMPIIEGNCSRRNITLIGLTSYKLDPGAMGDPRKLPRGQWQYTMSNLILELTKKEIIVNEKKKPIGHVLDCRIKKSKNASYNGKNVLKSNFYYDGGFDTVEESVTLFLEEDVVIRSGSFYKFADENGEEMSFQGRVKLEDHLQENLNHFNLLTERYKSALNG